MKNSFYTNTKLVGLLGHPLKHSFSPFIQNIAFQLKGLDYIYLPFDVAPDNLENALKGVLSLNIKGLNVTIPYKEKIMDFIDELSDESAMIGSVNTIMNDDGKLIGYNTDVYGIVETLAPYKKQISNSCVTVIGAGGAARAVIFSLIRYFKPKEIVLINRTEQRAHSLQNYFSEKMKFENLSVCEFFPPDLVEVFSKSALIVNTTSIGMHPQVDDSPTSIAGSFQKNQIVFDLVYNPVETKFLRTAKMQGAKILGGLKMLVMQAAKSFELWTGEEMPVDEVSRSLELIISK